MIAILNNIRIEIKTDEPLNVSCTALIVPNSITLNINSGINKIIFSQAGKKIFDNIKTKCKMGDSVILESGNLENCDYIINSCFITDNLDTVKKMAIAGQAIVSSLDLADKNGIRDIAISYFPEYLTSIKIKNMANIVIKSTLAYLKKHPFIRKVTFLTETLYEYDVYSDVLKENMIYF